MQHSCKDGTIRKSSIYNLIRERGGDRHLYKSSKDELIQIATKDTHILVSDHLKVWNVLSFYNFTESIPIGIERPTTHKSYLEVSESDYMIIGHWMHMFNIVQISYKRMMGLYRAILSYNLELQRNIECDKKREIMCSSLIKKGLCNDVIKLILEYSEKDLTKTECYSLQYSTDFIDIETCTFNGNTNNLAFECTF